MYIIMTFVVALFATIGYTDKRVDKLLFILEFIILGGMLCLRYGQGTDYFTYELIYSYIPQNIDLEFLFSNTVHGEIGYQLAEEVFRSNGASFVEFVAVWSLIMTIMAYRGITKYAGVKTVAVLLLFPTSYLTYFYAIRQGFGLAVTLCFILPAFLRKEKLKYILWVLLGATVHKSILILFVPLLFSKFIRKYERRILYVSGGGGVLLGSILAATGIKAGYAHFDPSVPAIAVRIILFIAIRRLYFFSKNEDTINDKLYSFYLVGFCIYLALCPMAFISHRMTLYMKISECILLSRLLVNSGGKICKSSKIILMKRCICTLIVCICIVEGGKNINSYIRQGAYYDFIHWYNYPYVSMFNAKEIYNYRQNLHYSTNPEVFDWILKSE